MKEFGEYILTQKYFDEFINGGKLTAMKASARPYACWHCALGTSKLSQCRALKKMITQQNEI